MEKNLPLSRDLDTSPYLSIVAASRNDDHGGDPLIRTQIFITNFARQCDKYRLPAEIIIVDWNPVSGRPGLAAVLELPSDAIYVQARVVTVPTALHQRLKYAQQLPLFQMIAKNVGIRRAKGRFVLATNIDIIFSDELMQFISGQKLDPKKLYRVDRYDIHNGLSNDLSLDDTMEYAWANPIRANRRYQPENLIKHLYGDDLFKKACIPSPKFRGKNNSVEVVSEGDVWQVRPERSAHMSHLHTNACGDFTLLSREGWETIRGYPEFASYSFNIDSMGLVAAHYTGYEEVSLLPPCVCFHIEHGIGSGWTPEGETKLFSRLRDEEILNPEWPVLTPLVEEMHAEGKPLEFNHTKWGMADFDLPEQAIGDTDEIPADKLDQLASQAETREVSAIQPAYDLDRLTLAHERRLAHEQSLASNLGLTTAGNAESAAELGSAVAFITPLVSNSSLTVAAKAEKVVLYVPDSEGRYWEETAIEFHAELVKTTTVIFCLGKFAHKFPLRFDPCQCPGLIKIDCITAFDTRNDRVVWQLDGRNSRKLIAAGTAVVTNHMPLRLGESKRMLFSRNGLNRRRSLDVISTGLDPQLLLPPLPNHVGFPLIISIEMKLIPFQ